MVRLKISIKNCELLSATDDIDDYANSDDIYSSNTLVKVKKFFLNRTDVQMLMGKSFNVDV
jgi:hypothetical protein